MLGGWQDSGHLIPHLCPVTGIWRFITKPLISLRVSGKKYNINTEDIVQVPICLKKQVGRRGKLAREQMLT